MKVAIPTVTPTIIFLCKDSNISLFQVEYFTIKTGITEYYLLPNSTSLKISNKKYEYVAV